MKSGRSANGKGHYWTIHPANLEDFSRGDFRRRRAQRRVRRSLGLTVPEEDDEDDDELPLPMPLPFPLGGVNHHNHHPLSHPPPPHHHHMNHSSTGLLSSNCINPTAFANGFRNNLAAYHGLGLAMPATRPTAFECPSLPPLLSKRTYETDLSEEDEG